MVLVWVVLALALVLFELHHLAFYALFGAAGCAAAAAVALVAPSALGAQAVVAVGVATAGAVGVRPFVSAAYERRHHVPHVARGVHGGIVGHGAVTLDDVGDEAANGHVLFVGERWLAVTGGGARLPAGTAVVITAVQGTTLVVWPTETPPYLPTNHKEAAPDGADGR